ncbi:hypothetical protein QJQ45_018809 [Haematococcus lacustris]|nr:hypothetical protein QJQ45_018809 [Haematococcus lacustris]
MMPQQHLHYAGAGASSSGGKEEPGPSCQHQPHQLQQPLHQQQPPRPRQQQQPVPQLPPAAHLPLQLSSALANKQRVLASADSHALQPAPPHCTFLSSPAANTCTSIPQGAVFSPEPLPHHQPLSKVAGCSNGSSCGLRQAWQPLQAAAGLGPIANAAGACTIAKPGMPCPGLPLQHCPGNGSGPVAQCPTAWLSVTPLKAQPSGLIAGRALPAALELHPDALRHPQPGVNIAASKGLTASRALVGFFYPLMPAVGAMLVSDKQNLAALTSLGHDLGSLMALVLNADTVRALEVKKSTRIALEALQDVAKRIYEYIEETKERKPWPIRLFLFALTRVEILELEQQLEKAKTLLQLTSNLEVAAIVLNSEAQAEAAGAQVKQIMARRGLTEQQLAADPTALGEVAAALAGVGSMKLAVDGLMLGALKTVIQTNINSHGPYRLVKNKVLSRLWQQYLVTELVTWKLFWQAFPDKVEPQHVKENLKKSLSDDRQKQAFRLGVDKCDKEVLSIDELNKAIPDVDETALPQVVMSITAQVRFGKSVNGIPPLPPTFVPRDDVATIAAMLQSAAPSQSNRTVVIHGWPGEGKRSTAQAVGHWMYEHAGVDSTYWVDLKHAGTKEDVQRLLLVGSGETLNPGSYREQLSLWLQHLSVRQPPAGLPTGSRLRAGPAHQPNPLLVVNDCEAAITAEARSELRRCLQEALDTVPGLRLVLVVQEGPDVLTQLNQLSSTPATYQLRQLPLAAAAQVLQNHLVGEGLKLSQADAELVAGNHGCNPRLMINVVECCKAYLKDGLPLDAVLRDMKSKRSSGDSDQALALISPLDDASRTALLVLSDTMPLEFDISTAKLVLGSSKQDSVLAEARQLRVLQDSQLLVKGPGAMLSMVAVARTFALHLLQQEHQSFAASIKAAKQRLPDARQAMLGLMAEEVAKLHATYITSPRTVYAAMIAKSPDIHVALRWLLEDGSLLTCNSTENVCHMDPTHTLDKVVTMLRHCCLGTTLPWVLDPELVQRACKRLGQCSKGVAETQGTCHAVRAMYFKNDAADLKWGHGPALEQAELAVQATASCTEPAAQLAAALALRAKGLILREQGSYAAAIAAHYQALQLLEPLLTAHGAHAMSGDCSREVRLEQVLQLAELSGTLDYAGQHQEGYDQGCRAVRGAEQLLGRLPHPVTALALGALGYNCRMLGKLEEAREHHSKALRMREEVLGRRHLETSMSLNQVALTRMDLAKQALARAVDGKGAVDEAHQRHARDLLVQAEMELMESLDIRKAGLGPHQPLVANTLRNLWQVQLLAAKGIPEASEADAKRAKAMVVLAEEVEIRRARHQTQKINDIIKELRQLGCEEAALALEKQVQ